MKMTMMIMMMIAINKMAILEWQVYSWSRGVIVICIGIIPYSRFFHGWKFSLFNFSWVDILAFEATLHRICIVEGRNFSGINFGTLALQRKYKPSENNPLHGITKERLNVQ